MEEKAQIRVQMDMLEKCLECKGELLARILRLTEEQEAILATEPFSEEAFEGTLKSKEELIRLLQQYDAGFEQTFARVREAVLAEKGLYQEQLMRMQALIAQVTEQSVRIQTLEQKNKLSLDIYLNTRKKQIKNFNVSNRTVANYYRNMAGSSQGESFFLDKKR